MFCNFFLSLKATTLLFSFRLKKSSLWSVDSNILDYRGFYVFRKTGAYDVGGWIEFFYSVRHIRLIYKQYEGISWFLINLWRSWQLNFNSLFLHRHVPRLTPRSGLGNLTSIFQASNKKNSFQLFYCVRIFLTGKKCNFQIRGLCKSFLQFCPFHMPCVFW